MFIKFYHIFLFVVIAAYYDTKKWIRSHIADIIGGSVVLAVAVILIVCHLPDETPIVVKSDLGVILDMQQLPENRGYNIKTDQMFARTNLQSYQVDSVPVGSRLYYIEQSSGRKGWLVEKPLP